LVYRAFITATEFHCYNNVAEFATPHMERDTISLTSWYYEDVHPVVRGYAGKRYPASIVSRFPVQWKCPVIWIWNEASLSTHCIQLHDEWMYHTRVRSQHHRI